MSQKYFYAVGRRKASVATVRLYPNGEGKIEINGKPAKSYFSVMTQMGTILDPLKVTENEKHTNITIQVVGGGNTGQAQAIRHGISRALVEMNPLLRPQLKKSGYLTRDSRKVERKKSGFKKARKSPQWSKR
jgi:small subunit ribosomal protein S9